MKIPEGHQVEELCKVLSQSFAFGHSDWMLWATRIGPENLRCLTENGSIVSGLGFYPFAQYFGGEKVSCAGIAGVGTLPHVRGQGKAKKLLMNTLRSCRENGFSISTLYAADWPIYRSCGYELAGSFSRFKADIDQFTNFPRSVQADLRPVSPANSDVIRTIYNRCAPCNDGWLDRNPAMWRRVANKSVGDKETENYAYEIGDGVGYFIYSQENGGKDAEISIVDYVLENQEAVDQFLNFLRYHSSIFKTVNWKGCPKGGFFIHNARKRFSVEMMEHWMLRILNVENAFKQRGYEKNISLEMILTVSDPYIEENTGNFILTVQDGKGNLAKSKTKGIEVNIATLSSIFSGFLRPFDALRMGRLTGPQREIEKLSLLNFGEYPWCPDYF